MPAATRIGDSDVSHCSGMVRAQGSGNVFVNSIPWSRQGDVNSIHKLPGDPCPVHAAGISSGSGTVFVNSKGEHKSSKMLIVKVLLIVVFRQFY